MRLVISALAMQGGRANVVRRRPHYVKKIAKRCTGCRAMKKLDEFHRASRSRDGHMTRCKDCHKAAIESRAMTKPEPKAKTCSKCKATKQVSEFYRDRSRPDGRSAWCKGCQRTCFVARAKAHPERIRKQRRRAQRKYHQGVTQAEVDEAKQTQGGVCAICREKPTATFHADHCHETGRFRGLLCGSCNKGIGLLKDSPETCERAAAYLRGGAPSA